ncbi:division/cell wall cluster transcriptional repressor MraZ [Psychroflexus salinarum]|uniref:Transcriptional regulator MraZ n=1 Tax=Psychroflexus salinarum TaxID=546024 RepID=A0ABW3GSB0_9FLAO
MNTLIGSYECKVDTKGRLMLPSGLKKQMLPIIEEGFVLKRSVFQPCLELYPMSQWNLLMDKMDGLNRFNKKNNDFIRKFSAGVKVIEVDASGRLLIPKDLISFAAIEKEIVVSSAINIVEIWDKEKYESVISDSEDFADLAEDVMNFETNE